MNNLSQDFLFQDLIHLQELNLLHKLLHLQELKLLHKLLHLQELHLHLQELKLLQDVNVLKKTFIWMKLLDFLDLLGMQRIERILLLEINMNNVLKRKLLEKLKRKLIFVLHMIKLNVIEIRLILLDKGLMKC